MPDQTLWIEVDRSNCEIVVHSTNSLYLLIYNEYGFPDTNRPRTFSNPVYSVDNKSFDAIPTKGIYTVYNHIGDVLALVCVIVTVYYLIERMVLFTKRKVLMIRGFKSKTVGAGS